MCKSLISRKNQNYNVKVGLNYYLYLVQHKSLL